MAEMREKDPRARVPQRMMTQALAEEVVKSAQAKAKSLGIGMSVAVVHEFGNLAYFVRGNNCGFHTAETARGKAVMAASFRRPTHEMLPGGGERLAEGATLSRPKRQRTTAAEVRLGHGKAVGSGFVERAVQCFGAQSGRSRSKSVAAALAAAQNRAQLTGNPGNVE